MNTVRLTKVIETTHCRGDGTVADPNRTVRQFWSPNGKLLAEDDPHTPRRKTFEMLMDAFLGASDDTAVRELVDMCLRGQWQDIAKACGEQT